MNRNERATGAATLQILTAVVLISGATTTVVIEMTEDLQQEAESTADNTLTDLLSGLRVLYVWGDRDRTPWDLDDQNVSIDDDIVYLEITARLNSWGHPVDLHDLLIEFSGDDRRVIMGFDDLTDWYLTGGDEGLSLAQRQAFLTSQADEDNYTALAITDPRTSFQPHMVEGNQTGGVVSEGILVKLFLNLSASGFRWGPAQRMTLTLIPNVGLTSYEALRSPTTMTDRYVRLV